MCILYDLRCNYNSDVSNVNDFSDVANASNASDMTLTLLAMIVHLLKLALLMKTMTLVASWTPVTLGTLVRLPSLVIKRDEHLKRNYFGFINILLAHAVTFVGHWGCEQHHRNCINTA